MEQEFAGFTLEPREGGVYWLVLNRPSRLNALTQALKRDLLEVLSHLQMNDDCRVLVITGAGNAFCSGDDVGADAGWTHGSPTLVPKLPAGHHDALGTYNALRTMSQAVNIALRNFDKPTIAAINGVAVQTGLSLALCCDFRLASSTARLGSATLRFGLQPDEGGHWLLVQVLGVAGALDFLLRRRIVDAEDALRLGLVTDVIQPESLEHAASDLAAELAKGPQVAQRILKRLIYRAADQTFEDACDDIAIRTGISDHHPDAEEGLTAFRERRGPEFQ